MKFLTNIDLNKNELQNISLQKLASHPANPVKSQMYYNTTDDRVYWFDGTDWVGADAVDAVVEVFTTTKDGLVPKSGANTGKFLKGDGTWANPPNDDTKYSAGDGLSLDGTTFKLKVPANNLSPVSANAVNASGHTHKIDTETDLAVSASENKFPTAKAVKDYADNILGANDAMVYIDAIDASSNPNYPAADAGHTYKISKKGKLGGASGVAVEIGDMAICIADDTPAGTESAVGSKWNIIQTNIDGAVIGPSSATDGNIPLFNGATGKLIKNSTYKPSSFANANHDHDDDYPKKYTATLGGSTSQTITHNLGTRDVVVTIRETNSPYAQVIADVEMTTEDTVKVYFATAPSANQYTITIVG